MHPEAMILEETNNPKFDRKRYDQFKLQLDYLLNLPEIKFTDRGLANFVLKSLENITRNTDLKVYAKSIAAIERYVIKNHGYKVPPARSK